MRLARLLPAIALLVSAASIGLGGSVPGIATAADRPEALFATPGKSRAAADYWTFARMDTATPMLPDILDPVTLQPIARG